MAKNSKKILSTTGHRPQTENGFVILLTILIVTIAISVAVGAATLVKGQISISGTTRGSQKAFYAADSGVECAIYWDTKRGGFSTSTASDITCAGQTKTVGGGFSSDFSIAYDNGACADIRVVKDVSGGTRIESRGYNVGEVNYSEVCESELRRVERGLRASY